MKLVDYQGNRIFSIFERFWQSQSQSKANSIPSLLISLMVYLCTRNVHINDSVQWNQTCVLYNDYSMYIFMYHRLVSQYPKCSHNTIQQNQTCMLYNDHLMYSFVHVHWGHKSGTTEYCHLYI